MTHKTFIKRYELSTVDAGTTLTARGHRICMLSPFLLLYQSTLRIKSGLNVIPEVMRKTKLGTMQTLAAGCMFGH